MAEPALPIIVTDFEALLINKECHGRGSGRCQMNSHSKGKINSSCNINYFFLAGGAGSPL